MSFAQNVGINTNDPKELLHVNGTMRFEPAVSGTNPAATTGKVLTSDADGNATWQNVTLPINASVTANYATATTTISNTGSNTTQAQSTGTSITLPVGTWLVTFVMDVNIYYGSSGTNALPNDRSVWVRSSLYDSATSTGYANSSADILDRPLISKEIVGPATNTTMIGEFKVKNSGPNPKTYYYMVSTQNSNFNSTNVSRLVNFAIAPQTSPVNRLYATKSAD